MRAGLSMNGLMLKRYTAGLDAGLIKKMSGAGSMPDPDFGENLTSLLPIYFSLVAMCKIFKERDLHRDPAPSKAPVQAQADPSSGSGPVPALTKV